MRHQHPSSDNRPCALLFRKQPEDAWELHCYTLSISVAWRSADMLLEVRVHSDGLEKAQVAVMLRELYDEGRGTPLEPPSGFEHLALTDQRTRRGHKNLLVKAEPPADPELNEETGLSVVNKDIDFESDKVTGSVDKDIDFESDEEGLGAIDKDMDFQ